MTKLRDKLTRHIKFYIALVIFGLAISGLTAFPLESETGWLANFTTAWENPFSEWLRTIANALNYTNKKYPYLSYGTDWLAFAHLMLAILFIEPYRNPVKNKWVVQFGMVCCIAVVPFALIAGGARQIPVFWRLIDCSFGIIGLCPLMLCYRNIIQLEKYLNENPV